MALIFHPLMHLTIRVIYNYFIISNLPCDQINISYIDDNIKKGILYNVYISNFVLYYAKHIF